MYIIYKDSKIFIDKINRNKNKSLIILPGWGDNRETFKYIKDYFKEYNYYSLDYPGFGKSEFKKELNIYDYVNIIKKIIIKENIKNINIIAHSFGGRIASILISKEKIKVDKLVLIDVAGIKNKNILLKLKILKYKILKKLVKDKNKLINKYGSSDYNNLPNYMKKTFTNIVKEDLSKYYKKINIETLILWGLKDNITSIKEGNKIHKYIKKSSLITFNDLNHFSYLERPYLFNIIISKYLEDNTK